MSDYFATYVERDLRQLVKVHNLQVFETFVRMCAGRVGQLLNLTSLANDVGISTATAREWLGLLETSFILFRLPPYHANLNKRLVKSPKLYFYDVGLAAYLCGIEEPAQLAQHPLRGFFFENLVIADVMKTRLNAGREARLHFYRDHKGVEVDLLFPDGPSWIPIEIKSGATFQEKWLDGVNRFRSWMPEHIQPGGVVYGGDTVQKRTLGTVTSLWNLQNLLSPSDS